jgi:DNA primase
MPVVVEGPLDALAITAAAAVTHTSVMACTTAGVAVTLTQADQVASLSQGLPVLIALDGDAAGRAGAARWVDLLHRRADQPVYLIDLPEGSDPADWIATHGPTGLGDLLSRAQHAASAPVGPQPEQDRRREPLSPRL